MEIQIISNELKPLIFSFFFLSVGASRRFKTVSRPTFPRRGCSKSRLQQCPAPSLLMTATVADVRRSAALTVCSLLSHQRTPLVWGRVQFDLPVGRHLSLNRRPFLVWVQGNSLAGLNSAFITETTRARQSCINKSSINEGQVFVFRRNLWSCFSLEPRRNSVSEPAGG